MRKSPAGATRSQDAAQLRAHALAGDLGKLGRGRDERPLRGGLDRKPEATGEAHGPQHAQGVLAEAHGWLAHRTDNPTSEVLAPAERVNEAAHGMPRHRVHGEVATRQVLAHVAHEGHGVGMPTVGVGAVDAVGGDLHGPAVNDRRDGAVVDARLVHGHARGHKRALGVLPAGARAHVDVVGGHATQGVAHPAAHEPRLVPRRLERLEHGQAIGRRGGRLDSAPHAAPLTR